MLNAQLTPGTPVSTPAKRRAQVDDSEERPAKKRKTMNNLDGKHNGNGSPAKPKANGTSAWGKQGVKPISLAESRKLLPIWPGKEAIVKAVKENDSIVIIGEPGSGKTTQVPQYLLDAGVLSPSGLIAVTQPRKVAATTIATRVAAERSVTIGNEVGYSIRFEDISSPHTRIKFYTDGMLLREMLNDPALKKCEVVIVDEAHERTLRTDMLLANLKRVQKERKQTVSAWSNIAKGKDKAEQKPLKIIVMSASLQAEKFSKYLNDAPVLYVKGRQHPVRIFYTKEQQEDYIDSALRTFFQIHNEKETGDVLIFLPGQEDIEGLASTIRLYANQQPPEAQEVLIRPLYAAMPVAKQYEAFSLTPANTRKVVLATNIAETSVTIPGIRFVIDCGLCNEKRFLAQLKGTGLERLSEAEISKSSAIQRAGRAGRDAPGKCFRLYTESAYNKLAPSPLPEIKRCDLTFATLQQKYLGKALDEIEFMDPPDLSAVKASRHNLVWLGALDPSGMNITPIGKEMARLPLEPRLSRALIESKEQNCVKEMINIASILSAASKVFFDLPSGEEREAAAEARKKFWHRSGDHITLLNVFQAWDDISASSSNGDAEGGGLKKSERKEWCRRQYINERALEEATRIRTQIQRACAASGMDVKASCGENQEAILKSLFKGLVHNVAIKQADGQYKAQQTFIKIHPASVLCEKKPSAIMFEELVLTSFPYARCVSHFPPSWQMDSSSSFRKVIAPGPNPS